MIKTLINIALAAFLLVGIYVSMPADAEVFSMHEFTSEYLPLNERIDYEINALDSDFNGQATITIKKITHLDRDMLLIRYEGSEGESIKEDWEVKLLKDDLSPFYFELTRENEESTSNYTGSFSGKQVTINVRSTEAEPYERIFSKGRSFYLSIMLPYLLRNIECEPGDWYTFNMLRIEKGTFITPIVQVKDREIIEVPAGMYDCWKVSIKLAGEQHWAWYSCKDPHYLIRYQYPDKELNMKRHY
jgi:hypothetical protein